MPKRNKTSESLDDGYLTGSGLRERPRGLAGERLVQIVAARLDLDEPATPHRPLREITDEGDLITTVATRSARRLATERLFQIEERREVAELLRRGWSQRRIADALSTTQPRIHRIQKILEHTGGEVPETPEEIILRALVTASDRRDLVHTLSALTYTASEFAPYPAEGKSRGTWEDIEHAAAEGWLTQDEYGEIRAAAGPE